MPMTPLHTLLEDLAAGRQSAALLTEAAIGRRNDPAGEGERVFIRAYDEAAGAAAAAADRLYAAGIAPGPLQGLPIAIKDLFDVAGEPTTAGSVVLAEAAPATADALIVRRLRAAGAVIVGKTNMSEFAYSAVGINPHYGTPLNPFDRRTGRVPGGSSSGSAVAVTDGMAAAAIGTDTGGSIRIPAALCGLVGFKPTAKRVPLDGTFPLAPTLDSTGPLAPSVDCCARLDAVLAGETYRLPAALDAARLTLGVPVNTVTDGLDASVAAAFAAALARLRDAGVRLVDVEVPAFAGVLEADARGGFSAAQSFAWHRRMLEDAGDRYDRRVRMRILRGAEMSAADYIDLVRQRRLLIADHARSTAGLEVLVMPTLPIVAPAIAALEADDAEFFAVNGKLRRNPSIVNFLDGCAVSLPCHEPGTAPVGLMLTGPHGADRRLLEVAAAVEAVLARR